MAEALEAIIRNSIIGGISIIVGKKHYELHNSDGLLLLTRWNDNEATSVWDDGARAIEILKNDGVWLDVPTYWRNAINEDAAGSILVRKSKEFGTEYFR